MEKDEENLTRLVKATKKVNEILVKELPKLSYFNAKNINENSKSLKKEITIDRILSNGNLAVYISKINKIIVQEDIIDEITDEKMVELILHEDIRMASTDSESKYIGFESKKIPIVYNEACTQWLTLKLMYGKEKIEEAMKNNSLYTQSVKRINNLIKKIGEDKVFYGFFEADLKKNLMNMTLSETDQVISCINEMKTSREEISSKYFFQKLQNRINNFRKKEYASIY